MTKAAVFRIAGEGIYAISNFATVSVRTFEVRVFDGVVQVASA